MFNKMLFAKNYFNKVYVSISEIIISYATETILVCLDTHKSYDVMLDTHKYNDTILDMIQYLEVTIYTLHNYSTTINMYYYIDTIIDTLRNYNSIISKINDQI